jgi:hypothetical protein
MLGIVLLSAGCGSPSTGEVVSGLQPAPLGDGISSSMLWLDDSTGPAGGGDWDVCRGKATCPAGQAIAAVSEIPGGPNRRALCRAGDPGNYSGQVTATLYRENGEQRRAARLGDWAYGYQKLECGIGEYVSALSENARGCYGNNAFHGLRCAAGQNIVSDTCTARTVDSGDSRAYDGSGDWDSGAYKAECGPASYLAGLSLRGNGAIHSVLCCARPSAACGQVLNDTVDLLPFFCPECVGEGSSNNRIRDGECFNTHARSVNNRPGFRIAKSCGNPSNWEDFAYDGSWIYHFGDTTWTSHCPQRWQGDAAEAMAVYFDGATAGGKWVPRYLGVGQETGLGFVVSGYYRDSCQWCPADSSGNTFHNIKLVYHKTMDILGTCREVVRLAITAGAGTGENYWYARGLGWIGYASIQQGDPADPTFNFWTSAESVQSTDGAVLPTAGCGPYPSN